MTGAATRIARGHVRVKVCGITRPQDAAIAERAGADAIGLIFAPNSKRRITPERAEDVVAAVGPFVGRVGVFVDAELADVEALVRRLRLTAVQLHGNETAEYARELRALTSVVRATAFTPGLTPLTLASYPADAYLLDAANPGSGTTFAWEAAAAWRGHERLILAGGLSVANVGAAVRALAPYAVDVASGVESSPGVKDPAAVEAFVRAARGAWDGQWSDR